MRSLGASSILVSIDGKGISRSRVTQYLEATTYNEGEGMEALETETVQTETVEFQALQDKLVIQFRK